MSSPSTVDSKWPGRDHQGSDLKWAKTVPVGLVGPSAFEISYVLNMSVCVCLLFVFFGLQEIHFENWFWTF